MTRLDRWRGGGAFILATGVVGGACLAATLVDVAFATRRALYSYLFGWVYWAGLAIGALILLGTFHAVGAKWAVVLRRAIETMAGALPLHALLFLPIAIGVASLYRWVDPTGLEEKVQRLVAHRRPYLNVWFFELRAALYFAVWIAVAELLLSWSRRQDEHPGLRLTVRQRRLASGTLPIVVLFLSFASTDWILSLEQRFKSSIFGLYVFTGLFLGAIAAVALVTSLARGENLFGGVTNPSHRGSLGKLMLGFVAFWFYVGFCQYMLVWIADLPDEVHWYLVRTVGNWHGYTIALVVVQFLVPFLLLLSRPLKTSRAGLAVLAAWVLAAHAVDVYWLILPAVDAAAPSLRWTDVTAFVGIGGVTCAFVAWRLRGHATVPVSDPFVRQSLGYAGE